MKNRPTLNATAMIAMKLSFNKKKSPVILFTVMVYIHQCCSSSPQAVLMYFLKAAGAYDSDMLGKPAAASACGTANTRVRDSSAAPWLH